MQSTSRKMTCLPILLTMLISTHTIRAQTPPPRSSPYLSQKPPALVPQVFAPNLVSQTDYYEYGSIFSKQGREFFYAVIVNAKPQIRCIRFENKAWTSPITLLASDQYEYNDPFLSPDESRLYFISDRATDGKGPKKDFDIWYIERKKDGWSKLPINAGSGINSAKNEYYMSFTKTGTMYFSSNGGTSSSTDKNYDIRFSPYINGTFQASRKLSHAVNSAHYEADVFVSPNEDYLIFCAERPGGFGNGDLYISFKSKTGEWQQAKNMGPAINTKGYEFCPFVTAEGKYFFFSREGDIYWVSAAVIDGLRKAISLRVRAS
ncbi:PD40 domain-containing protein [Spirosoma foliorum]|uniref:PD40 domain-containing protein n=1 Tax=Spirosoma foliorum TaxID=2710596 RepID=A0A7G5H1H6_9BACT|nr:PD40 domain-containing protein [Spirosoma foliorum]QMW04968.1 PD40 domain-containing protein [Spirosoma foliorum]